MGQQSIMNGEGVITGPVRPVELVEVNVVRAQTLQAAINGYCDGSRV